MSLAELTGNPIAMWFMGLSLGLWVAINAYIFGRGRGYGQGVRYCLKELEPVQIELAALLAGLRPVSEGMRSRIPAAQEEHEETRH